MEDRNAIILALIDQGGVGPRIFQQMLLRFGRPENFMSLTPQDLEDVPRVGPDGAEQIVKSLENVERLARDLDDFGEQGIRTTSFLDDDYPDILRQIDDPPPILFMRGAATALEKDYIALVGTTQATQPGLSLAVDLSREFVRRGFGVVSGLALGIDSASHLGALKENGVTMAVLGSGVLNVYPPENAVLADNIAASGLLISEHQPYKTVKAGRLIVRNRLISAFAKAVVVVQVGEERRGELRTANYAIRQARPVFIADPESALDAETIKNSGALLISGVESIDEIIKYTV